MPAPPAAQHLSTPGMATASAPAPSPAPSKCRRGRPNTINATATGQPEPSPAAKQPPRHRPAGRNQRTHTSNKAGEGATPASKLRTTVKVRELRCPSEPPGRRRDGSPRRRLVLARSGHSWSCLDEGQKDLVDDLDQGVVGHGGLVHDQVVAYEVDRQRDDVRGEAVRVDLAALGGALDDGGHNAAFAGDCLFPYCR